MKRILCLILVLVILICNLVGCAQAFSVFLGVALTSSHNSFEKQEKERLKEELLGEWVDSNGNYIRYTREYTDYENNEYDSYFETNLITSKVDGNNYYYYIEYYHFINHSEHPLIVGYTHKTTKTEVDNFKILFYDGYIKVENLNDGKTYTLYKNENFSGIQ